MGLFDIVQYEVQVAVEDRWQVRGRYTRADREAAFTEARRADLNDGLPAKVIRDVYDPHTGRNHEITVFASPRARDLAQKPRAAGRACQGSHGTKAQAPPCTTLDSPASLAFRATMALGAGVVTAMLLTAIASWAVAPARESFASVLARTPSAGPSLPLFLAIMLFSVMILLRGPLGIARLARTIADHVPSGRPQTSRRPVETAEPVPFSAPAAGNDQCAALARVLLSRFFAETAPANLDRALEDPLGRRGLALYLAGAAGELATAARLEAPAELASTITPAAFGLAVVDVLKQAEDLSIADAGLLSAGRTGMGNYLAPGGDKPSMAPALVAWHKLVTAEAAGCQ